MHRAMGQGLKRQWLHELRGALGEDDVHPGALLDEKTGQFRRLIGGDPAAYPEND